MLRVVRFSVLRSWEWKSIFIFFVIAQKGIGVDRVMAQPLFEGVLVAEGK